MLQLKDVRFQYTPTSTNYAFSLQVEPGEILGISGKSGSGKSTLLDLVAGFLPAQSGQVILNATDLTQRRAEQRPISILFQKDNVFDHLTAQKNVEIGLEDKSGAPELLGKVGLKAFLQTKCAELSGGQQQRVALARTLGRDKPILLLDEPFSALDDETADEMRQLVRKLVADNQWHTILVSHHQKDLNELATRQLNIHEGQVKEI